MARHWNYRVIKHPRPTPDDEDFYAIHEVFYNDLGAVDMYTETPCGIGSDALEELPIVLKMVNKALSKPVLDARDLPGYDGAHK